MGVSTCAQCGQPVPEEAKFCGQCGAVTEIGPPTSKDLLRPNKVVPRTMVEFQARDADNTRDKTDPSAPPQSMTEPVSGSAPTVPDAKPLAPAHAKQTMLGVAPAAIAAIQSSLQAAQGAPAIALAPGASGHAASPTPPGPVHAGAGNAAAAQAQGRTMLGVAVPGIAPINPGAPPVASAARTMLGVARPGIAPSNAGHGMTAPAGRAPVPDVPIVPPPQPFHHEPAPVAPNFAFRRGMPLAIVAIVVLGFLVLGATLLFRTWKAVPPITAQAPRVDRDGKEVLPLRCDDCKDGTSVELNGARATFANHEATVPLNATLHIGDNPLTLRIDRPGMGRDEAVQLTIPINYRLRLDLSSIQNQPPAITVVVDALPGSDVRIEDNSIALDASGHATYALDISKETEGPSDSSRAVTKTIRYTVTPKKGQKAEDVLTARWSIAPLRVDTPNAHSIIESDRFVISGRVAKGSTVTVNGEPIAVTGEGFFERQMEFKDATTLRAFDVRATAPNFAPRTVHLNVRRVNSVAAETKPYEQGAGQIPYDAALADLDSHIGKLGIVEGEVIESRISGNQTLLLVGQRQGCAHGPCPVRVVVGQKQQIARGETARAYGRITRGVTVDNKTIPEFEADFVIRGRK